LKFFQRLQLADFGGKRKINHFETEEFRSRNTQSLKKTIFNFEKDIYKANISTKKNQKLIHIKITGKK